MLVHTFSNTHIRIFSQAKQRQFKVMVHLLVVRVFGIVVAVASLVLVVDTVAGLVEVCVEIVKPRHLSVWGKHRSRYRNTGHQLV